MDAPRTAFGSSELWKRYLLWIDGLGGFLICLGPRVTLGQAQGEAPCDVSLLADVSRHHAALQRDGEGYHLETTKRVRVNHQVVARAFLRDKDRITLGHSCQLQFHQPAAHSPSARLELVSSHRFELPVRAVLLMAETLIVGPDAQAHVVWPRLATPVTLLRSGDGLLVHHAGPLQIDGHPVDGRGLVPEGKRVQAGHASFTLELLPR